MWATLLCLAATSATLLCAWADPQLLAAANRMRAAVLPPPGSGWRMYFALHGANIGCANYLSVGWSEQECSPPERLIATRILRDGLAKGSIDWATWEVC